MVDHADVRGQVGVLVVPVAEQVVEHGEQPLLGRVPRLHQVVVEADVVDGLDGDVGVGVRRQQHALGARGGSRAASASASTSMPVIPRHPLVDGDQGHRPVAQGSSAEHLERLVARTRPGRSGSRGRSAAQVAGQSGRDLLVVVHRDDRGSGHHPSPLGDDPVGRRIEQHLPLPAEDTTRDIAHTGRRGHSLAARVRPHNLGRPSDRRPSARPGFGAGHPVRKDPLDVHRRDRPDPGPDPRQDPADRPVVALPLTTFVVFTAFVVYATWRAFSGRTTSSSRTSRRSTRRASATACEASDFGQPFGWFPLSAALIILIFPLGFRLTCYYYRKAYYRSFWLSPPACAVAEPHGKLLRRDPVPADPQEHPPLLLVRRDRGRADPDLRPVLAFGPMEGEPEGIHMGLGTLILLVNIVLIWLYTLSCHSCRTLVGGRLRHFSKHPVRYRLWTWVSRLNADHARYAWLSLFSGGDRRPLRLPAGDRSDRRPEVLLDGTAIDR